jgi:oligoribonuclease NrnB/cAMP/cGMP phosphodiesterase (DHH superfamily)
MEQAMTIQNKTPILCIYHGNCADGFGAAWVVRRAFAGSDIEFHPATHGNPAPDVTGKKVIIVDFSYPLEILTAMAAAAESVLVLDHHKTAQADLEDIPAAGPHHIYHQVPANRLTALFDMHRSGAGIAWDYFFLGEPRPALINHIEDRDLWLFKLEGTREIQASLFSFPYDFDVWDALFEGDVQTMRAEGVAIERKHHKDVAELVRVTKRRMVIGGYDVPVANLPYTLTSDAGHMMCAGEPFAACYWDTPEGRSFSLRSTDAGEDVSAVAKKYGGGGHRNASGFRVSYGHDLAI